LSSSADNAKPDGCGVCALLSEFPGKIFAVFSQVYVVFTRRSRARHIRTLQQSLQKSLCDIFRIKGINQNTGAVFKNF
jgi:hypothetical protein